MQTDRDSLMALARSGDWPPAAAPQQVVPDDDDAKRARAADVLNMLVGLRPGQSFLDYGCGEGHMVAEAASRGNRAAGYDPVWQEWDRHGDLSLHSRLQELDNGPYDRVLLYDVLDHAGKEQAEVLERVKSLLAPGGRLLARCHPFVAIHGTHLYGTLNLAWAHLLLEERDLQELGGAGQRVTRVTRPLSTYQGWFREAGLRVVREEVVRTQVPPMFHDPDVLLAVARNCYKAGLAGGAKVGEKEVLHGFLSIQFVDYELSIG